MSTLPRLILALVTTVAIVPVTAGATTRSGVDPSEAVGRLEQEWRTLRTASTRIVLEPGQTITPEQLVRLEQEIEDLSEWFGLSDSVRADLRRTPIAYVLTADTRTISRLSGIEAEAVAFAEDRVILATSLPHTHELVHVLAPLALPGRPTDNVSFLVEGLASALGGHGGEAPSAVFVTADEVLSRARTDLGRLFTESGFDESPLSPHERYAVAARFVDHLVRTRGGWPKLRELMRLLAGRPVELAARPLSATLLQLEGVYGVPSDRIFDEFLAWCALHPATSGMREIPPPVPAPVTVRDERHRVAVWQSEGRWWIEVVAQWGPLGAEVAWGERQIPRGWTAAPTAGERYVLSVDRGGARLRDLAADRLVMRWEHTGDRDDVLTDRACLWIDAALVGEFDPTGWTVWSHAVFPPR